MWNFLQFNDRILDSYIFPSFNTLKIFFNCIQVSTALIKKVCILVPRINIFFLFSFQQLEYDILWYGFICSASWIQKLRGSFKSEDLGGTTSSNTFYTLFSFSFFSGIPILHVLRLVPIETSHWDFSSSWLHLPAQQQERNPVESWVHAEANFSGLAVLHWPFF